MYLLTLKTRREDGAYAVQDKHGDKVLFLFEEEDDADRYAMMLEDDEKYQNKWMSLKLTMKLPLRHVGCIITNIL